jgi:hypothetical protein
MMQDGELRIRGDRPLWRANHFHGVNQAGWEKVVPNRVVQLAPGQIGINRRVGVAARDRRHLSSYGRNRIANTFPSDSWMFSDIRRI